MAGFSTPGLRRTSMSVSSRQPPSGRNGSAGAEGLAGEPLTCHRARASTASPQCDDLRRAGGALITCHGMHPGARHAAPGRQVAVG